MTEKSSKSNPAQREEIHIYCIAHCSKCLVDTSVEQQRLKCQVCTTPLEYFCTMCKKQFVNAATVKNHIIKQLGEVSTLSKCQKCYRTDFTTRCSFIEHERKCNTTYRFDKEMVLSLESCNYQPEIVEDVKPAIPDLSPESTNHSHCEDSIEIDVKPAMSDLSPELTNHSHCEERSIETDNNFSYVYDDMEIGEDFKPPIKNLLSTSTFYTEQTGKDQEKLKSDLSMETDNRDITSDKHESSGFDENVPVKIEPNDVQPELFEVSASRKKLDENQKLKVPGKRKLHGDAKAKHLPLNPNANKCKKCKKSFCNRSILKRHSKICGQPKDSIRSLNRYLCDHCNYETNHKGHLTNHIQAKHSSRDPTANKCSKCSKSFLSKSGLWRHSKFCGQSKDLKYSLMRFICNHCNYKTIYKNSLVDHIKAKHLPRDPNAFKCNKCNKSFSWRSNLQRHLRVCGRSDDIIRSLQRYNCDHCNYKTNDKGNLAKHIQAKHLPQDSNAYECKKCKKSFSCASYLQKHLKICSQSKDFISTSDRYICDYCNYKTYHKGCLATHIQAKHLPRDPNANKCKMCSKSFYRQSSLMRHSKTCV